MDQALHTPQKLGTVETDRQYRVIRFAPESQILYGASYDALIRRWDLTVYFEGLAAEDSEEKDAKKKKPQTIVVPELEPLEGHQGWVESLVFAAQRKLLISTDSWGNLLAWDVAAEQPQLKWKKEQAHDGWLRGVSLSEDESLIATAGRDQTVRVWSTENGELLHELTGHDEEVFCVVISPDNKTVISSDLFAHLRQWDLASGKCTVESQLEKMVFSDRDQDVAGLYSLRFHDDGQTLLGAGSEPNKTGNVGGTPTLSWLDPNSFEVKKTMHFGEAKHGYVYDYIWHPDGTLLLVTSGAPGAGQFLCQRLEEEKPFFTETKMTNCHSLAFDAASNCCIVAATNRNSQGNGAVRNKEGKYLGNTSPLTIYQLSTLPVTS